MKNISLLILLFFSLSFFSQKQELSQEKIKNNIEDFVLQKEIDSANFYLKMLETSEYKVILEKIIFKKDLTYHEQNQLFSNLSNRTSIKYIKVSNFIDEIVRTPETKVFNESFFRIKCDQIYNLRNDVSVEEASKKYKELESYLSNFNKNNITIQKAKLRIQTHPIILFLIEKDVENGKKLTLKCLEKSEKIKDIELQIMFLYHLTDFLVLEGKLQEYIDVSEKSLELEKQIPQKSSYYHAILDHLIDAYIYKGGYDEEVLVLMDELYNDSTYRIQTYSLYLKFLSNPNTNLKEKNKILDKFQAGNVKELVEKFQEYAKDLNQLDTQKLLFESSRVLEANNYLKDALAIKDQSIILTKKIYSQDLSKSLADFKVEQAVKIKQQEIEHEQVKNRLYLLILILVVVFLVVSLLILRKVLKQSKELSLKNKIIKKTLKEKELLVKEVHHRVKNNFQIVASLLELQAKGITDKKALKLANESKNRIKSMALIHQKLYQNETGLVDFNDYILVLTRELSAMYSLKNKVTTNIDVKNMFFEVDTAIPLGLIINEILTNSYKYAFNDRANSHFKT